MGVMVLFSSVFTGRNAQAITISLKTVVTVENVQVKLIDVADVDTANIMLKNNLNGIKYRFVCFNKTTYII